MIDSIALVNLANVNIVFMHEVPPCKFNIAHGFVIQGITDFEREAPIKSTRAHEHAQQNVEQLGGLPLALLEEMMIGIMRLPGGDRVEGEYAAMMMVRRVLQSAPGVHVLAEELEGAVLHEERLTAPNRVGYGCLV